MLRVDEILAVASIGRRCCGKPCMGEGGSSRDGEKWLDTVLTPALDQRCMVNGALLILIKHDLELKTQECLKGLL